MAARWGERYGDLNAEGADLAAILAGPSAGVVRSATVRGMRRLITRQAATLAVLLCLQVAASMMALRRDPVDRFSAACVSWAGVAVAAEDGRPGTASGLRARFGRVRIVPHTDTRRSQVRPTREQYFMLLAVATRERANCLRRHVGAVLVADQRIIATGYNGTPTGFPELRRGRLPPLLAPRELRRGPWLRHLHLRARRAKRGAAGGEARLLRAGRGLLLDAAALLRLPQGAVPVRRQRGSLPERVDAERPDRGRGVRLAAGRAGGPRRGRSRRWSCRPSCSTCARQAVRRRRGSLAPVERERLVRGDGGLHAARSTHLGQPRAGRCVQVDRDDGAQRRRPRSAAAATTSLARGVRSIRAM